MISSSASLPSSPPFPSRSPFPKQKPASKDHKVIQSSRLHHWLPLSQVPIYKGRSSEPLLSRVFVSKGIIVVMARRFCTPEHYVPQSTKNSCCKAYNRRWWLERWFLLASSANFQRLAASLPGLVCPYRQAGPCPLTTD